MISTLCGLRKDNQATRIKARTSNCDPVETGRILEKKAICQRDDQRSRCRPRRSCVDNGTESGLYGRVEEEYG